MIHWRAFKSAERENCDRSSLVKRRTLSGKEFSVFIFFIVEVIKLEVFEHYNIFC
jgi:hypothetical protein